MTRPDFDAVSALAAIVRNGSFRKAASERGVTASALSHAITRLEKNLGVRLLIRSTRALQPTDAGARLLTAAGPALSEIETALAEIEATRDTPTGRIRITAPRIAAAAVLAPRLSSFVAKYPAVALEISVADEFQDIAAQGFDAGIRLGEALRPDMIAIPVSKPVAMAVVASPAYLEAHPPIKKPGDVAHHDCIGLRLQTSGEDYAWEFRNGKREIDVAVKGALTSDDQELIVSMSLAGLGLAYTLFDYVEPHLKTGRLVRVLENWTPADARFFLYHRSRKYQPAALRAFVSHLSQKR